VSVTISADDPRTIRAVELAADAGQWLRCRSHDGEVAYGVPSQADPGRYYLVTHSSCDCPDFRRNGLSPARLGAAGEHRPCKHVLAVRLYSELVEAQAQLSRPGYPRRRGHLTLLGSQA
jgi:SWIM zinc finger